MSKKIKTPELEIVVSRYWPLQKIKSVNVKLLNSTSSFHNDITFTGEQVLELEEALKDILNKKGTKDELGQPSTNNNNAS